MTIIGSPIVLRNDNHFISAVVAVHGGNNQTTESDQRVAANRGDKECFRIIPLRMFHNEKGGVSQVGQCYER